MSHSEAPPENRQVIENLEALNAKAQKELEDLVELCKQKKADIRGRKRAIKDLLRKARKEESE